MNKTFINALMIFVILSPAITAGNPVQLPEAHRYQSVLRNYMEGLTKSDFEVELKPYQWQEQWLDADAGQELHRIWLLTQTSPIGHPDIITTRPEHYTLDSIESPDGIRMGWRFAAPEPGAWLADWKHPVNPYQGDSGLINRILVVCAVDMMMHDQMHDRGQGRRSDWLGGTMIWLSYAYYKVGEHWPEQVRESYEAGLNRMVDKMQEWGPTAVNDNMDTKSVVAMHYIANSARNPELREKAEEYARRVMDRVHPSGMIMDAGGLEASYHGIATFFMAWATAASDWEFLTETFDKMSDLKAYLTLPHGDRYISPSHFNTRTSFGIDMDQWSFYQRDVAAAMISDHAFYHAFGGRRGRGEDYAVRDSETMLNQVANHMTRPAPEPSDKIPPEWSEAHWPYRNINYAADYYRDGFYGKLRTALDRKPPEFSAPFERKGETFLRNFADTFLVTRHNDYGAVIYTGPLGWHNYMNYAGGALSAFWTPQAGTPLLGHAAGDHTRAPWEEWRQWPSHALSGETDDGLAFSSARIRRRVLEVEYERNGDKAEVRVSGPIGEQHDGGRAVQNNAISGDARYARRFALTPELIRIESVWTSDGTDAIAEMYECLPVFIGDERWDQSPSVHFRIDGQWKEIDIVDPGQEADTLHTTDAIRIAREGNGILIELDRPRGVRPAPQMFQDDYMTRNRLRNIHISLIDPVQEPAPVDNAKVQYTIRPINGQ